MQKSLDAIKQGIKPPACRPKPPMNPDQSNQTNPNQPANQNSQPDQFGKDLQDCDQYCADSSHVEECVKFSVAMGNMTEAQGQNAIKNGNKGPGGCVGRDACNTFCDNPDNQDACFNFGKDNGMIPEADLQKMQQGQSNQQGQNQQGQQGGNRPGGPNQGQGFNPGSGQNGNGPGMNRGGANQNGPVQPNQQIQMQQQPAQFNQGGQPGPMQPGQPNQGNTNQGIFSPGLKEGDCGTGPGTCSGIGPDDIKPGQPGQMQPQQQFQSPPPPGGGSLIESIQSFFGF